MNSFEIDGTLARTFANHKLSERRTTTIAASLGLPVGLALSIGIPLATLPQIGPALLELLAAAMIAQPLALAAQQRTRNSGWLAFSEFLGYMGAGLGVIGTVCKVPGARIPLSLLGAQYEDEGRYPLAQRLFSWATPSSKIAADARSLTYPELMEQAEWLQLLFNAGKYDQCTRLGETLLLSSSRLYYDDPSENNQVALWNVQSQLVAQFFATGQCEKAKAIWSTIKSMREFSSNADKATIAQCYNNMSRAGIAVADYYPALRYAMLARDCFERAEIDSRMLAGDIALNMAHAYLKLDQPHQAQFEANHAMQEWSAVLTPYAGAISHAHYVLGMVELQSGQFEKAEDHLHRARTILHERVGTQCLQTLPVLVALRQCLIKLERLPAASAVGREIAVLCKLHNCKPAACTTQLEDMTPTVNTPVEITAETSNSAAKAEETFLAGFEPRGKSLPPV